MARLELVVTLRELGLGLPDVRRVLDGQASIAEVAAVHLDALDAQIRALRLHRAVLSVVVKRAANKEEMTLMNKPARMSVTERPQMIDEFLADVFGGLDPSPAWAPRWNAAPNLPDDPSPEQVDAWVEIAELVSDPGFRQPPAWWAELDGSRPVVVVTQGTLANRDLSQLVEPALAGLAGLDVTVVAALGREAGALSVPVPPNAHVAEFIPFDVLLPKASVYITNGGLGGTQQAIAAGVPVIVAGLNGLDSIAASVGYSSGYAFSRAFRRARAQSPGQFRVAARAGRALAIPPTGPVSQVS